MSDAEQFTDVFCKSSLKRYEAAAASYPNEPTTSDVAGSRLNCITHLLRGWVWETDKDHRFTYLSDSVLTYTGRPPEWHYGRKRQELVSYYIEDENLKILNSQLNNREPFGPFEYQRTHEGQTYWVRTLGTPGYDERGEFWGYQGVAQDVTSEMHARIAGEQWRLELVNSDAVLRATIDCFPVAVSVFDSDHRMEFANAHFYSLLGLSRDSIGVGTLFSDIIVLLARRGEIYGGDVERAVEERVGLITSGVMHCHQRTRPNGVRLKITTIPLPNGGFVRTHADITENTELSNRLERATAELQRQKVIAEASSLEIDRLQRLLLSREAAIT